MHGCLWTESRPESQATGRPAWVAGRSGESGPRPPAGRCPPPAGFCAPQTSRSAWVLTACRASRPASGAARAAASTSRHHRRTRPDHRTCRRKSLPRRGGGQRQDGRGQRPLNSASLADGSWARLEPAGTDHDLLATWRRDLVSPILPWDDWQRSVSLSSSRCPRLNWRPTWGTSRPAAAVG